MMITSRDNELIKEVSKLISASKYRKKSNCFVAEGVRLCRDAANSGALIKSFLYTSEAAEKYNEELCIISKAAASSAEISRELYDRLSDTGSPQGFLCVIDMNSTPRLNEISISGKYAALENIQDPSNLGTILRTAEALGVDGVILSEGCCDIFSPKVVRGSMGAVFRLPFMQVKSMADFVRIQTSSGAVCYASAPRDAEDIENIDFSGGAIMLIGNEGNGLKEETISCCTKRVKINMKGRAESLNAAAAAAILLYRLLS